MSLRAQRSNPCIQSINANYIHRHCEERSDEATLVFHPAINLYAPIAQSVPPLTLINITKLARISNRDIPYCEHINSLPMHSHNQY